MIESVNKILADLVACDTQNPPREITADHPIFGIILDHLPNTFESTLEDHGQGAVTLLVKRGQPKLLFNVHLDTVPCGQGWTTNPLALTIESGLAVGRGVCDIKGAAAAMIAAAGNCEADFAILFSTDEEAGDSRCIKAFCKTEHINDFSMVVVAEPTECRATLEHRGFLSAHGTFSGVAGHSSRTDLLAKSATHAAVRWANDALQFVEEYQNRQLDGRTACFNLGRLDGGTKDNVTADRCQVTWSMRLPPMSDDREIRKQLMDSGPTDVLWKIMCFGPPLPQSQQQQEVAQSFAEIMKLTVGSPVDFWTEAALFSHAGLPAIVLGPGNIAQAHTVQEWVELAQLEQAANIYQELATNSHRWIESGNTQR